MSFSLKCREQLKLTPSRIPNWNKLPENYKKILQSIVKKLDDGYNKDKIINNMKTIYNLLLLLDVIINHNLQLDAIIDIIVSISIFNEFDQFRGNFTPINEHIKCCINFEEIYNPELNIEYNLKILDPIILKFYDYIKINKFIDNLSKILDGYISGESSDFGYYTKYTLIDNFDEENVHIHVYDCIVYYMNLLNDEYPDNYIIYT